MSAPHNMLSLRITCLLVPGNESVSGDPAEILPPTCISVVNCRHFERDPTRKYTPDVLKAAKLLRGRTMCKMSTDILPPMFLRTESSNSVA